MNYSKYISNSTAVLALALALTACGPSKHGQAPKPGSAPDSPPTIGTVVTHSTEKPAAEAARVLQITVLNFLSGGLESCDVKNKVFTLSMQDKNAETILCENSKVSVSYTSDAGMVSFHAFDRIAGRELSSSNYPTGQAFKLGEMREMIRYAVSNPYGFTYVMAEDVTGIDPALLARWNELNTELSSLKAKVLEYEDQGLHAPAGVFARISAIEKEMAALADEMEKTRTQPASA